VLSGDNGEPLCSTHLRCQAATASKQPTYAESGEPPLASSDVNDFVQTGLRQRPEILLEQATVEANQHALKAARTFNAPSLSANLGFNGLGPQFFPQNQAFTVGAILQFNPFDGGLTAGLTKQARGNLATAQA
jgi:outer membrane protein TolC